MDFFLNKIDKFWDNLTIFDEKVKDLKRKREQLNALKEDTESRRRAELHTRKKLKKEVELWFREVERINGEILDLEQEIGGRNAVSRGLLTGNVLKKIVDIEELLQQGKFPDGLVVDNLGWIGQALSTTALYGEAAENCMKEIWAYLMDDDIQKIGVWGMGGIGKTTIMKLIHNQLLKENEKFNIVIWVTVSKETNISKIQNRIAQEMNVKLDDDEDETIRAGKVYEMLARKDKYVLILDDLWDRLSLEEVGIPEPSNGSKLLVTTRSLDVCCFLDCREVKVPTLSKPDAWELFLEKVGREVLNHPNLLSTVESVAEECAGLPLAIVTIASSMRGVRDIHVWSNALHDLKRQVKSMNGMEEKVFQQLQFSYDRLRDERVKYCFLCCALYPEDWAIDADELIQLWIAEGLVEEMDSMDMEIDKGHTILNDLKNSCLIENTGYSRVKLHDVVRDMALRITSVRPRFLVRAGMKLKEIPNVQHWKEDLTKTLIEEMDDGIMTKLTSLQLLKLINDSPEEVGISVRGEEIGGLRKLEIFEGRFDDLNELNNYGQALQLAQTSGPRQYHILVSPEAEIDSDSEWDKEIDINGGDIDCTHGIKIPSDVQYLGIRNVTVHLSKEEEKEALFCSGFIIPVPHNIFSSLARIEIFNCKNIKKLFSPKSVLHSLQNLKYLTIMFCDEMEEIIASESEITSSTTASASASFKFTITLPMLRWLTLRDLPELKSICGANVQLVCDSIEEITITDCPKIKRIPLKLPLQDNGQPSPPPSLPTVYISSEEWWETVEWDHPNAKSLLEPHLEY